MRAGHAGSAMRGRWAPLAAALLLLLTDEVGNGAGDAAYQGPVLIEADASIMVGIQVLDELVSSLAVPRVLGRNRVSNAESGSLTGPQGPASQGLRQRPGSGLGSCYPWQTGTEPSLAQAWVPQEDRGLGGVSTLVRRATQKEQRRHPERTGLWGLERKKALGWAPYRQHVIQLFLKHLSEAALADLVLD